MSSIQPRVSVIIPTFNHGHLISRCLESLQAQSIEEWEAIVVNNLSSDDTVEVVSSFNDKRIKLVNFSNGGVIAAARNHGVKLAQSEYLAFLDSDDIWYPKKLEAALPILNSGFDIVCHAEKWISKDGLNRMVRYGPNRKTRYENLLFGGNCLSTSAVMMTRKAFNSAGGFSENHDFITAEDYDLWLKVSRLGCKFFFIDVALGEYHLHGGNQSHAAERHHKAVVSVLNSHFSRNVTKSYMNELRKKSRIALAASGCARMLQANSDFKRAYPWIAKSIREWPFSYKPWAALFLNAARLRR